METQAPRALSIELALVVGLPLLTLIAGAITLALAYGQGFTAIHGG